MLLGAQKGGRFLGHQIADRKWSRTVCDHIMSANVGSIKWHHNGPRKITFLSDSISSVLFSYGMIDNPKVWHDWHSIEACTPVAFHAATHGKVQQTVKALL